MCIIWCIVKKLVSSREMPYFTDYFMAMAFLSSTRSKDKKHY
ncbi:hypothetical protein GBAR_LOCUS15272, partial [Geodia barretti]